MSATLRRCVERDCSELSPATRCPAHTRTADARRGTRYQRGYTAAWRTLSARYRRGHPICELRYSGCQVAAVDTDHRVPLRAHGPSTWSNCVAVCRACHARKTREDATRWPT